jgi:hypothetical protein
MQARLYSMQVNKGKPVSSWVLLAVATSTGSEPSQTYHAMQHLLLPASFRQGHELDDYIYIINVAPSYP